MGDNEDAALIGMHAGLHAAWTRLDVPGSIPEIAAQINAFLDPLPLWTFDRALQKGYGRLVARVVARDREMLPDGRLLEVLYNDRVNTAAQTGDIGTIVDLMNAFPRLILTQAPEAAAASGHIHVLDWLFNERGRVCWSDHVFHHGIRRGNLAVLRWLDTKFPVPIDPDLIMAAIRENCDEIVEWLWLTALLRGWPQEILQGAISAVPLDMAKWMWANRLGEMSISLDEAAYRADLQYLNWARGHGAAATTRTLNAAVRSNDLDTVEWVARNYQRLCTAGTIDLAADIGNIQVLDFLFRNFGVRCSPRAFILAARNGNLAAIQWLFHHYPEQLSLDILAHAAGSGYLHVVQWLTERQVAATTNAVDWAAASGHLIVVQWLHENRQEGCTAQAMDQAASNGHFEVVQWLHHNRAEGCTVRAIDGSAAGGHLNVIMFLHENRHEGATTDAMDWAAEGGYMEVFCWLHANRTEGCTSAAMDKAIANGNLDIVRWIHLNRNEGCTPNGMDSAVASGDIHMLTFLHRYREEGCNPIAFAWAVAASRLHIAQWLVERYPEVWNLRDAVVGGARHGWDNNVVRAAFGDYIDLA